MKVLIGALCLAVPALAAAVAYVYTAAHIEPNDGSDD